MNYAAIADRAQEIGGDYLTAFSVMAAETEIVTLEANWESRLAILSRLGVAMGATVIGKIEAAISADPNLPDILIDMVRSERGVNLADPETIGLIGALVAGGALTQAEADALLASNTETTAKWPGLKPGHVQNALEQRAAGEV